MSKNGITVYLPRDLELRVQRIARDQHRSESSVITEAVRARYDKRDGDAAPAALGERYGSRLDARFDKAIGEALILKEVVLLFIRVWLEHNPPIDDAQAESAAASAEARFQRFLELVAQGLQPGGRSIATFAQGDDSPSPSMNGHDAGEAE